MTVAAHSAGTWFATWWGAIATPIAYVLRPHPLVANLTDRLWSLFRGPRKECPMSGFNLPATADELEKLAAEAPHLAEIGMLIVKAATDLLRHDEEALVTDGRALAAATAPASVNGLLADDGVAHAVAKVAIWIEGIIAARIAQQTAAQVAAAEPAPVPVDPPAAAPSEPPQTISEVPTSGETVYTPAGEPAPEVQAQEPAPEVQP